MHNLKNNLEKGAWPWETRVVKKTSKKAKNKAMPNSGRKQRTSLKNNKMGDQNWYCRNKNGDSVIIFDELNEKALSSPIKMIVRIGRENLSLRYQTNSLKRN